MQVLWQNLFKNMQKPATYDRMEWQPIKTAPKDGTEILLMLMLPGGNKINVVHNCYWCDDLETWVDWDEVGDQSNPKFSPQYWMPLPQPFNLIAEEIEKGGV